MGYLIAIEGGDGSGKATQAKLLGDFLASQGIDVKTVSFPRYGEFSAQYIERYLNNQYGTATEIPADLASLPYALDRFAAAPEIREHIAKERAVVILDRSTTSNMAHQGTKFENVVDRHRYYKEMIKLEYGLLGIPKPDIGIVLLMPAEVSQANVDKKAARNYTDKKRDGHEADQEHLQKARANYEELVRLYPNDLIAIQCMSGATLRSIEDIQGEIQETVTRALKAGGIETMHP